MDHRLVGTAHVVVLLVHASSLQGVLEGGFTGWVVSGTLLGPEGSGVYAGVFQFGPHLLSVPSFVLLGGVWGPAGGCGGVPPVC